MCVLLEFQRFWNCGRCTTVDEIVVMHCCTRLALGQRVHYAVSRELCTYQNP